MKFEKGVSGNPNGRPKGSLNKKTRFAHALADFDREHVAKLLHVFYKAGIDGDILAGKTFLEYVIPKADKRLDFEAEQPNLSHLTTDQLKAIIDIAEGREISQPV